MIKMYLTVKLSDEKGKTVYYKRIKSHSFLRGFIAMLKGQFAARMSSDQYGGNATVKDVNGADRGYPCTAGRWSYLSESLMNTHTTENDDTYGIAVGTGDLPNSLNTCSLDQKISHGTGAGQLLYGAPFYQDVYSPSSGVLEFKLGRTFTNVSGATITVKEVGIIVRTFDAGVQAMSVLIARDVITPINVQNGYTLTVIYTPRITVS